MYGIPLVLVGLSFAIAPAGVGKDVDVLQDRKFNLSLNFDADEQDPIDFVRVFVSVDRGTTWQPIRRCTPADRKVLCLAPDDGLYWFAVQVVFEKDGRAEPEDLADLTPVRKVYVKTKQEVPKVQRSSEDLRREVDELRQTVEHLQKRIAQLERKHEGK